MTRRLEIPVLVLVPGEVRENPVKPRTDVWVGLDGLRMDLE